MHDLLLALLGVMSASGLGLGLLVGISAAGRPARVVAPAPEVAATPDPVFSTVTSSGWVRPQA